ncbi:MAG: hypothetical protein V2A58_05000 [Planctomycetota bacterium]
MASDVLGNVALGEVRSFGEALRFNFMSELLYGLSLKMKTIVRLETVWGTLRTYFLTGGQVTREELKRELPLLLQEEDINEVIEHWIKGIVGVNEELPATCAIACALKADEKAWKSVWARPSSETEEGRAPGLAGYVIVTAPRDKDHCSQSQADGSPPYDYVDKVHLAICHEVAEILLGYLLPGNCVSELITNWDPQKEEIAHRAAAILYARHVFSGGRYHRPLAEYVLFVDYVAGLFIEVIRRMHVNRYWRSRAQELMADLFGDRIRAIPPASLSERMEDVFAAVRENPIAPEIEVNLSTLKAQFVEDWKETMRGVDGDLFRDCFKKYPKSVRCKHPTAGEPRPECGNASCPGFEVVERKEQGEMACDWEASGLLPQTE